MALEPSDLLETPYTFGESSLLVRNAKGSCKAFEDENFKVKITARKQGDWVNINIPNILEDARSDVIINYAKIRIEPFLPAKFLGDKARKRFFGGLARVLEEETSIFKTVPAVITMEEDGAIVINPCSKYSNIDNRMKISTSSNWFISRPGKEGKIGTLNINFTYVIDDGHEFDDEITFTKYNMLMSVRHN